MKGTQSHLSHKCISPIEVEIRVEVIIVLDLDLEAMHIGDIQCTIKTLEVGIEVTLATEEITDITCEVVRGVKNNYNDYRRNNYRGQGYDRNRSRSLDRQERCRRRDRRASYGRSRS